MFHYDIIHTVDCGNSGIRLTVVPWVLLIYSWLAYQLVSN